MENNLKQMGVFDWFGLLFVAFKLAGIIDWNWLLVLSPFIIPWGILLICGIIIGIINMIKD